MKTGVNDYSIKHCANFPRTTVVVDVDDEGNVVYRPLVGREVSYEAFRLNNLIKAGIDPSSVTDALTSQPLDNYSQLESFSNSIKD